MNITEVIREGVIGAYRTDDPETSKAAARSIDAAMLEEEVLWAVAHSTNGLTAFEIADKLGMALNSISPRTAPLQRKNLIEDSGRRRKGPSGRSSIVWQVKKEKQNA